MKTLHEAPMGGIDHDASRRMPPGGGLMIAIGLSFMVWGTVVWEVVHR